MKPFVGQIVHYKIEGLKLAALVCHYEGMSCNLVVWDSLGMPKMIHGVPHGEDEGHWRFINESKLVTL